MKSVEAYDYYENKWTYLPDMIEERCFHASISIGNIMFVIGGWGTSPCEVFDSFSRKFTSIKSLTNIYESYFQAISIGNVIVVFSVSTLFSLDKETKIYQYNIESNDYSAIKSNIFETLVGVSCVKYYTR